MESHPGKSVPRFWCVCHHFDKTIVNEDEGKLLNASQSYKVAPKVS